MIKRKKGRKGEEGRNEMRRMHDAPSRKREANKAHSARRHLFLVRATLGTSFRFVIISSPHFVLY